MFSLFSDLINDDVKSRMASKLLTLERDSTVHYGKPVFPSVTVDTQLWDLITSESWQFFDIVQVSPDWLTLPPNEWESSEDYRKAKEFVRTTKVTNDVAERGVGMARDYMTVLTTKSEMREKLFQVVEWDRRQKPDVKKSTMNK